MNMNKERMYSSYLKRGGKQPFFKKKTDLSVEEDIEEEDLELNEKEWEAEEEAVAEEAEEEQEAWEEQEDSLDYNSNETELASLQELPLLTSSSSSSSSSSWSSLTKPFLDSTRKKHTTPSLVSFQKDSLPSNSTTATTSFSTFFISDLKKALHYQVGKICKHEEPDLNVSIPPFFIAALAQVVVQELETITTDLEAFAKHRGKITISAEDVKLCARRNSDLYQSLCSFTSSSSTSSSSTSSVLSAGATLKRKT